MLYAYYGFLLICFFSGIVPLKDKEVPRYLRLFWLYMLVLLMLNAIATYLVLKYRNAHPANNIVLIVSFAFYFFVLHEVIRRLQAKRLISLLGTSYTVATFIHFLFSGIMVFNALFHVIGAIAIVIICIYYFYEKIHAAGDNPGWRDPASWICLGLLFFYACTLPLFGLGTIVPKLPQWFISIAGNYLIITNCIFYTLLSIGFCCRLIFRRRRNIIKATM